MDFSQKLNYLSDQSFLDGEIILSKQYGSIDKILNKFRCLEDTDIDVSDYSNSCYKIAIFGYDVGIASMMTDFLLEITPHTKNGRISYFANSLIWRQYYDPNTRLWAQQKSNKGHNSDPEYIVANTNNYGGNEALFKDLYDLLTESEEHFSDSTIHYPYSD